MTGMPRGARAYALRRAEHADGTPGVLGEITPTRGELFRLVREHYGTRTALASLPAILRGGMPLPRVSWGRAVPSLGIKGWEDGDGRKQR